jgi:anaerobic ribonucleoside-triphosphate reductase activating protein
MPVKEVFKKLTVSRNIEGVTLLGGEPFDQAEALVELSKQLRERRLSILAYSGRTIQELKEKGGACRELVELCDLLIDGKYIRAKAAPLLWRGSTNQNVHFITDKYRYLEPMVNRYNRDFEIMVTGDKLVLTGDPPPQVKELFKNIFEPKQNHCFAANREE